MNNTSGELAPTAFIALGSNLGDSVRIIRAAMDRLDALSSAPLVRSSLWRSAPVDCPPGSPPFINAVAGMIPRPDETPHRLLQQLQAIEREFGRQPKRILNEPRPLDLDIIAFGGIVLSDPVLTLPHPRAAIRNFVLAPLTEIAPQFRLPGCDRTVQEMLSALKDREQIERVRSSE